MASTTDMYTGVDADEADVGGGPAWCSDAAAPRPAHRSNRFATAASTLKCGYGSSRETGRRIFERE
jgi:hypothetical protein